MAFPYKINEISCFYGKSRFLMLNRIGKVGYRTFCVFFNVNEASVYRALLAFIFSEKIFEGGQKVL